MSTRGPVPQRDGRERPLDRLRPGEAGVIARVEGAEPDGLKHLAALGLLPGTRVEVRDVAPFRGPLLVRVGRSEYALGRDVAARILVKES